MKTNDSRLTQYIEAERYAPPEITTGVLRVVVPYTTPELTRAALRDAGVCSDLDVHVHLVDIQIVPFPCPLNQPPDEVNHVGSFLRCCRDRLLCLDVGFYQGSGTALGG